MIAKVIARCLALLVAASGLTAVAASPELTAKFDAPAPYGVPGVVLPAGSFTINVLDHLSDRYIVQVKDQAGEVLATFLGLPSRARGKVSDGKVSWATGPNGVSYLKGWSFQSAAVNLEFVYPKNDAVAIAQANNTAVAAIDPASDGLLAAHTKDLSQQDLQIVTLWLLTPTRVGATASIGAKKYSQAQAEVASAPAPAPEPAPAASVSAAQPTPPPTEVASVETHRRPALRAMHALPHTASNLAWFYLVGVFACAGALGLRMMRLSYGS